jgi:hypothetical protein
MIIESGQEPSIPPHLGLWWMAAQTFIRWSHHGVWERLLELAQPIGGCHGTRAEHWLAQHLAHRAFGYRIG